MSSSSSSKVKTLQKVVKRLPAQLVYYGSALGAIVLAGGGQLPPGLEFVAGGVGANLLSNLVDEIARGEDVLDDEIRRRAEDAITQSDIANLLTKQDFLQGYARLLKRLDEQKIISQDILDELRTGFSSVATSDQVEDLKQLLLQLIDQPAKKFQDKTRVFISYARADDEPFVERLYHDLKDEFDVWWDRVSMPNRGLTFLQEIRDAIDHADRLLLVSGPRAFTSDYVRDEWLYAYETYKGINIALRLGDYPDLPEQLGGFDAPDFRSDDDYDERLATLKRQLAEPVAPVGQFHNVPALPPHFLNRPEALNTLRDLVIADVDKPTLISAEKRTTAVEGMGGIGKSVLATAFAHDRKVRFAFPEGIVWLTAGRDPSMYELYRAVGIALGDELSNYPDETTARQNAQKALVDKKCLLILDDVWELAVGRAFRDIISGTSARLLITTRNLQINDVLNANEYRLRLIDKSQAVDYLRSWVDDDPKLDEIAKKLGYLFLALKLAGARMKKDGLNGTDYLRTFNRVSRMKIDRQASDREDSLEASIMLSVDAAFANAEDEKLLYHTFGIFPEDTPVPQQTVMQLWRHLRPDVDEFDLLETLNALVDLALVERNADDRTITLHDLLHNYTREKLGDRYVQTHQDFLDSYGVDEWHQLSLDEPYLWSHLAHHLVAVESSNILLNLLTDYRWLQAKLNATDIDRIIADFDHPSSDLAYNYISSALKISRHLLIDDKTILAAQLVGRLCAIKNESQIRDFIRSISENCYRPYLLPRTPLAAKATGPLIRTLPYFDADEIVYSPDGLQFAITYINYDYEVDGIYVLNTRTEKEILEISKGWCSGNTSYNSNGSKILSTRAETIHIWDARSGSEILFLEGHIDDVISASFNKDDTRIVSASKDNTIRVWDANTGDQLFVLDNCNDVMNCIFSSAGNYLISASSSTGVQFWDATTGTYIKTLTSERINDLEISPDGKFIAASCYDGIHIWEVEKWAEVVTFATRKNWYISYSPNGNFIASASSRGIAIWDIATGKQKSLLPATGKRIGKIQYSKDGKHIVSASEDGVQFWDANWQGDIRSEDVMKHNSKVSQIIANNIGSEVISLERSSNPEEILIWDIENGSVRLKIDCDVESAMYNANSSLLLSTARYKSMVTVWESATGEQVFELQGDYAMFSPNSRYIISSYDKTIRVWDIVNGSESLRLNGHEGDVIQAKYSPDGERIVSAAYDRTVRVWDAMFGREIHKFNYEYHVENIILSPDGNHIILHLWNKVRTSGVNPHVTSIVIDMQVGKQIFAIDGCLHSYDPNSNHILLVSKLSSIDRRSPVSIKICDGTSGQVLTTLQDSVFRSVSDIAFSPNGKHVAASIGQQLHIWNSQSGEKRTTFQSDKRINCIAWATNDRIVIDYLGGIMVLSYLK